MRLPYTSTTHANEIAERLRQAVEQISDDSSNSGTISIGVTVITGMVSEEAFLNTARLALEEAKHRGKNQVVTLELTEIQPARANQACSAA